MDRNPAGEPKQRCRKRGRRSDLLIRLQRRAHRVPLPSILLANVQSLDNKVDEIRARVAFQRDIRDCNVLCFTGNMAHSRHAIGGFGTASWFLHASRRQKQASFCAFVVETRPSMPQGKGPLVLRTNDQFSVKRRFLYTFPEQNRAMKVYVSIDREVPQIKGYRRFNVPGTYSKAMNMAESMIGGMEADFRRLCAPS
ncbi:uncharacterized protein LOC129815528 isoform X2 [Salvelinus fontinalis]|uniref:uncharacterized protein LOC129815528 isoform X2 n=1 Tax=Salvelinus fontinalis TaxID=8038 RepID=UPI002485E32D|nr:uncharacterized protein LOC129815528 isoform X2 [Salvelinus fontinalis]